MAEPSDVEEVAAQVLRSPKYRDLDPEFVRRLAGEVGSAAPSVKVAVKDTKRRLHQLHGAFATEPLHRAVDECIRSVLDGRATLVDACRRAMRHHRSSERRVAHLEEFYATVFSWVLRPESIHDIGCGLNPLAIPWMDLGPGAAYACCDIDRALVASLAGLSSIFDVSVDASVCDSARSAWTGDVDLLLALQLAPTIESQRRGSTAALLAAATARTAVFSMPVASLSGRRRYLRDNRLFIGEAATGSHYRLAELARVGGEELFLLERR